MTQEDRLLAGMLDSLIHMTEMDNLVYCYDHGIGTKEDYKRTAELLNKKAEALNTMPRELPPKARRLIVEKNKNRE